MDFKKMPSLFSVSIKGVTYHFFEFASEIRSENISRQEPHKHFFIEFHYMYEGVEQIELCKEKQKITLNANELGIVPQGCYHRIENDTAMSRFCFLLSLEFDKNVSISDYEEQKRVHNIIKSLRRLLVVRSKTLTEFMHRYREWCMVEGDFAEEKKGALLLAVLFEVFDNVKNNDETSCAINPWDEHSAALWQKWTMEKHFTSEFASNVGISGLAQNLYLSERHTRTLVKECFGKDYKDIIIEQRMELAKLLIGDSELTLEEIAAKTGYRSYSGFYLAYLRYWGVAPGTERVQ